MDLTQQLRDAIREVEGGYHRLVLLVGLARSGKTPALRQLAREDGWPLFNINLELSSRLLELTARERRLEVSRCAAAVLDERPGTCALLDNTELLFARELELDSLRLLQSLSRNRTLVVAWDGEVEAAYVSYAQPGHPEYRRWSSDGLRVVLATTAAAALATGAPLL